ncbi:MAG TPA: TetR/AcrR family transcriptional regulator C-terminal domain-containing protein [Tessaracoccus flavescens]|uniref:TetR/AcrR family transcriptional regulator C-terminal domain-containing protein n=1 Tax=Tessaracoccus flavescens TaxID=399497 RepID=A0A921EPX3_9ACTN|nr:TetR/AcrR family transcriptional regulator C-terminal domain-containing protein [Tessaracoccus flavescens]
MALTKAAIVDAGLQILDTYGLGDLSMRRVADSLGVQAGALYYHVPNKQSLLAAIADDIVATALQASDHSDLDEFLRGWARRLRAALLAHRDAAELVASAHAFGLGSIDPTGDGREILATAGSPHPAATMSAFLHFIVGHVMEEQTRAQMAQLGLIDGFDADAAAADFEWGLSVLIAGVHAMQPPPA